VRDGLSFVDQISGRVFDKGHCPSLVHHPPIQVLCAKLTDGDRSTKKVRSLGQAVNRLAVDMLGESIPSRGAAGPFAGIAIKADLISLRSVNSFQTNFDIADKQGVVAPTTEN
jgi:hypothetical protein